MKTWKIPVVWTMAGTVEIEAETLAEAVEIAKEEASIPDDKEYLANSWEIGVEDEDLIREFYNDNQNDE